MTGLIVLSLTMQCLLCKQNAVILILCKNDEIDGISKTIQNFEERFNNKFQYPYVFLNDQEFTDEFKERLNKVCKNRATFGRVDSAMWDMPALIDKDKAKKEWEKMKKARVPYVDRESYHNMCRFFSRSFYKHPLVKDYEFYWRVEPNVRFRCDIEVDPFDYMKNNGKKYGFVIAIREFMASIPTLAEKTGKFLGTVYHKIPKKENLTFMFENGEYNGCHFWSNFEIGSFEFFRSPLYNAYLDHLEQSGGFYYERWGDAPVHSLAVALLLDKSETHFFKDIGYTHDAFTHCPADGKNCDCKPEESVDATPFSCLPKYLENVGAS